MQAETMNCPMCGAPAATDAVLCDHCGARLATVACPSCFGLIFQGARFCSHCGARVERTEAAADTSRQCPHCRTPLDAVTVGGTSLLECAKCEGLWVDKDTLQQICADREKQAAVLGLPGSQPAPEPEHLEAIHYVPCPICHKLMNRVNFAHCSHVIVNVCMQDGTWFDKDELRKVVEFIRAGGLEQARQREIAELQHERSLERADRAAAAISLPAFSEPPPRYDGYSLALDAIGAAIRLLGRR
jgi:Zn-finger nucleic acid-binding protein